MLRRQGQRVPIPRAVLEGATAGISRRDFLRNGAIATITVYGASMLSWSRIWEAAAAQAATPGGVTDPIIVSIFLDGGNDGLNTLVPVDNQNYPAYAQARNYIGLDPNDCLTLAGPAATPDFKWNPAATGLKSLYDAGKMAVIPAVDYLPPDLSHFHSRAFWQAGELDPNPATGWLGRWVDQNGDANNPLQALSVDWTLQGSMKSAANPVAVLTSPQSVQYDLNGGVDGRVAHGADARRPGAADAEARADGRGRQGGRRRRRRRQPARRAGVDHDPAERVRVRHERLRRPHVDAVVADPLEPGGARGMPQLRRRLRLPRQPGEPAGGLPSRRWARRWRRSRPTSRPTASPTGC